MEVTFAIPRITEPQAEVISIPRNSAKVLVILKKKLSILFDLFHWYLPTTPGHPPPPPQLMYDMPTLG